MRLSEDLNFTLKELCDTTYLKYEDRNYKEGSLDHFANLNILANVFLQPIRDYFRVPIIINSGYRCAPLNKKIRGNPNSQHKYGEAIDFTVISDDRSKILRGIYDRIKEKDIFSVSLISQCILETKSKEENDWQWIHLALNTDRYIKYRRKIRKPITSPEFFTERIIA